MMIIPLLLIITPLCLCEQVFPIGMIPDSDSPDRQEISVQMITDDNVSLKDNNSQNNQHMHHHLVKILWNQMGPVLTKSGSIPVKLKMNLIVTPEQQISLERFVLDKEKVSCAEINAHFINMIDTVTDLDRTDDIYKPHYFMPFNIQDILDFQSTSAKFFGIMILSFTFSCFLWLFPHRMMVTSFFIIMAIIWEFFKMYDDQINQQQYALLNQRNIPERCKSSQSSAVGYFDMIRSSFNNIFGSYKSDECEEYHSKIYSDVLLSVNPLVVIMQLVAKVLLTPLQILGDKIGLFWVGLSKHIPVMMLMIIFPMILLVFMMLVALIRGYSFRMPFLFAMEAPRSSIESIDYSRSNGISNAIEPSVNIVPAILSRKSHPRLVVLPGGVRTKSKRKSISHKSSGKVYTIHES